MKRLGAIVAALFVLLSVTGAATQAHAQGPTFTVLYSFTNSGGDGAHPRGGLVVDAAGNLYGTTEQGGASGQGAIFKLDTSGNETLLHAFAGASDGEEPQAGLIMDAAGNLYGTASASGPSNGGTVFRLDPSGNLTVLHGFNSSSATDGFSPLAGVVMDAAGNLYGTTYAGPPPGSR